ncbi:MAG: SDR family oxidoreductase, partial [Solirubrobacterales bacterium]
MNVLVVGGHGKIALRLLRLLAERGDVARGLIRNPDHARDLERVGAEPVIWDLEATDDISAQVDGSDAVVFAAGAGPGSGPERKRTVDLGGATKLIAACTATGVARYLMVSAMGVGRPGSVPPQMQPYYEAKREADEAVRDSALEYTIVRPGRLTDEPGTGLVAVGAPLTDSGAVTRDDVAATLLACLDEPRT